MRSPHHSAEERYRLIMDCRQSGLSDSRWCRENGIKLSTFYTWIARFRKKGIEVPAPISTQECLPEVHQDVVRLDIVPDIPCPVIQEEIPAWTTPVETPTMMLEMGSIRLSIPNGTDLHLLTRVMEMLRSPSC